MKAKLLIVVSIACMAFSGISFSDSFYTTSSSSGSRYYNENGSNCQCADPACRSRTCDTCMSGNQCCKAFGNIGK